MTDQRLVQSILRSSPVWPTPTDTGTVRIDCRDPTGSLWGWDPNGCCLDLALFPLDQTFAQMLEESLDADYPEPFYDGYTAGVRTAEPGCVPLQWQNGRVRPFTALP